MSQVYLTENILKKTSARKFKKGGVFKGKGTTNDPKIIDEEFN